MNPTAIRLADCFRDFRKFCGLLQVVDFSDGPTRGQRIPMRLTWIQRLYCDARTSRDIVLKPRKVYMSTLELARDLFVFLTVPGARVVVVVQSTKDHEPVYEFDRTIAIFIDALRSHGLDIPIAAEALGRITMPSRDATLTILEAGASKSTAEKTGRGIAITRLHLSEVSSYEHGAETMAALVGAMPATGGEVTMESTPKGAIGYFFDQWMRAVEGRDAYTAHFFPWYLQESYREPLAHGEVIEPSGLLAELESRLMREDGVEPEQIKWLRARLRDFGNDVAKLTQEYPSDPESCFLQSDAQYIPTTLIDQCITYDPMPQIVGHAYAGIDFGRKNDLTVIVTVKQDMRGHLWVTEVRTCKRTEWDTQMRIIFQTCDDWDWRRVAMDETGMGSMPAELVEQALGKQRTLKVNFGTNSKEMLATSLYAAIAERRVTLPEDPELLADIRAIRRIVADNGRVSYDAPHTDLGHADRAWALALAVNAAGLQLVKTKPRRELGAGDFRNAYRT